ncbi:MAG: hypothetical protein WA885_15260 [Phormidesmis sp.]
MPPFALSLYMALYIDVALAGNASSNPVQRHRCFSKLPPPPTVINSPPLFTAAVHHRCPPQLNRHRSYVYARYC